MLTNKRRAKLTLLAITLPIIMSMPGGALAQNPTQDNQPVRGQLHNREADLKDRLQREFKAGRIDSTVLAKMQRDLDGICVKEDEKRTEKDGLSEKGHEEINTKLDMFEDQLNRRVTDRTPAEAL